jgi:nucleoid DNA-binding protein
MTRAIRELKPGDRLEIRQFGTFERKTAPGKTRRNPITGGTVKCEPYSTLRFKPSKMTRRV